MTVLERFLFSDVSITVPLRATFWERTGREIANNTIRRMDVFLMAVEQGHKHKPINWLTCLIDDPCTPFWKTRRSLMKSVLTKLIS
jgi:hypothetical protein